MRSFNHLLGLPVLDVVTGKRVGTVKDLLVNSSWNIEGVVLDYKSWFSSGRFVEWEAINSVGDDMLVINSSKSVKKWKKDKNLYFLCSSKGKLKGIPLISVEGISMGKLEDVYFSEKLDNSIIGLELSDGFLTDFQEGRRKIPLPAGAKRGEDVIIVPTSPPAENESSIH